jgi:hypothetical protein
MQANGQLSMAHDQCPVNGDRERAWAQTALKEEAESVRNAPAHEANDTLNRASFSLGQIAGGELLQATDVEDTLLDAALARKIPMGEARRTIKSGLRAGQRKPRGPSQDVNGSPDSSSGRDATGGNHRDDGRIFAARLWREARPIAGTPAELYLCQRGMKGELPSSLRFSPAVTMPCGSRHPAMLAAITDPVTGEFLALQRTALTPDGRKASIEPAKATLGSSAGGAVVIGELAKGETLVEGEGIETVLSATNAVSALPGIATLSSGTLGRVPLPENLTTIIILGEHGSERCAEEAAARRHAEGRKVFIAYTPAKEHKDLNGYLMDHGQEAVISLLAGLTEWFPPADPDAEPDMSIVERTVLPAPELDLSVFGPLAGWIKDAADAKNTPPDYVAMSLLAGAASMIGTTRWASPWGGWAEPAILWVMLVGNPSAGKSPAMDAVRVGVAKLEREFFSEYRSKCEKHETVVAVAEVNEEAWHANVKSAAKNEKEAPPKPDSAKAPDAPVLERATISDTTIEAAAVVLSGNPRGVILWRDELSAWVGNLDKYGTGDRAFWLEGYGGRPYTVDRRKLGEPLFIAHMAISVLGGIQPDRLSDQVLDAPADGLGARMLYVWPDPVPPMRPSGDIDTQLLIEALHRLRQLGFHVNPETGEPMPVTISVVEDALEEFCAWRVEHHEQSQRVAGLVADAYGKMPGQVLRIALVLEHVWWAAKPDAPQPTKVSACAMGAAMELIEGYVKPMLRRVAGEAALPKVDRNAATLARAILDRRPERINARDIRRSWRLSGLREASEVIAAIIALTEARWLERPQTTGGRGRPREDYRVNPRVYRGQR